MGEIADGVLDGAFCQECGEYLGEGDGFPRSCAGCGSAPPLPVPKGKRGKKKPKTGKLKRKARLDDAQAFLAEMGFKQMPNPWHYQLLIPNCPDINFWPSKSKWCINWQVRIGSLDELRGIITAMKARAAARNQAAG